MRCASLLTGVARREGQAQLRRLRPGALLTRFRREIEANTAASERQEAEKDLAESLREVNEQCKTAIEVRADWSLLPDRYFVDDDSAFNEPSYRCEDGFHGELMRQCGTEEGRARAGKRIERIVCRYRWRGSPRVRLTGDGTLIVDISLVASRSRLWQAAERVLRR